MNKFTNLKKMLPIAKEIDAELDRRMANLVNIEGSKELEQEFASIIRWYNELCQDILHAFWIDTKEVNGEKQVKEVLGSTHKDKPFIFSGSSTKFIEKMLHGKQ